MHSDTPQAATAPSPAEHRRLLRAALRDVDRHWSSTPNRLRPGPGRELVLAPLVARAAAAVGPEAAGHMRRVGVLARSIALHAGWTEAEADDIAVCGALHDVGKAGVRATVLGKPGPLTRSQEAEVRRHPGYGHVLLRRSRTPLVRTAAVVALQHHERWDGGGYPAGLRGEQIDRRARLIALADVYDALTSHRPYRPALTGSTARDGHDAWALRSHPLRPLRLSMERIRWLLRLGRSAAFGARSRQRLLSDDRVVTSAALATTLVAAWRVSAVIAASAASPGAAPAPAVVSELAPAPGRQGASDGSLPIASARAATTPNPPRAPALRRSPGSPRAPSEEVQRAVDHLVGSEERRANFEAALGRMSVYGPFIRATLRDQGVPQDLLYLPMIESAYRPGAVSHAGATGMWQFMRGTGAMYGLEVSVYVDERRDPVRSTQAAVRHLHDLYREFGSWHLALAAYNAGPPRVRRALRRHAGGRTGDERLYWRIRPHLASETRAYVPLFLAAAEIGRRPAEYGLHPAATPPLNFREVWYPGGTRLAHVAHALGLSAEQVTALNPHLVRGMTPPGRAWPVRVPPSPTLSHVTGAE